MLARSAVRAERAIPPTMRSIVGKIVWACPLHFVLSETSQTLVGVYARRV